jgi:nucleoside-diphosphate-sugar epimerase
MRLLILGGTAFVGRAVATAALAAGHDVTCAARGRSGPVPAGATLIRIDREEADGLAPLAGQRFDAVVDVSSTPSQVRAAVAALRGRVGQWTYVSSGSAYADTVTPGQDAATAPLLEPAPPDMDAPDAGVEEYGRCKVACEQAVQDGGVPAFICRAGLVVGPEDDSDRYTYWPVRLARGGEVLAPGDPADPVQFIDVRDLAAWLVHAAGTGMSGAYDGIGRPMSRLDFLTRTSAGVGRPEPELTWIGQDFLTEQGINPWSGERSLPLWLPLPRYAGFQSRAVESSLTSGLTVRDLEATARDTLAWYAAHGEPTLSCGLSETDESAVLDTWRIRG